MLAVHVTLKTQEEYRMTNENYPLFRRAEKQKIFDSENGCLISAPTATGKSYIGIEVISRNLKQKPAMEVFLYLVPFKALAEEVFSELHKRLPATTRIHIKTGDYDKPFEPDKTDVLVATYESIDGIIQQRLTGFYPSVTIADELSVISDSQRGARIEALIAHLNKNLDGVRLYSLSAVLENPTKIRKWLQTSLLTGDDEDRSVKLKIRAISCQESAKTDKVKALIKQELPKGNILIFCNTKKGAEKLCSELKDIVTRYMTSEESKTARELAEKLKNHFSYLRWDDIPDLVTNGLAFHHADLEVDLRNMIADAFRGRKLKVIAATPTLSFGVNLPARTVIVRDIWRYGRKGMLPVSEVVNMLGRAGRPKHETLGNGYFLVPKERMNNPEVRSFVNKVKKYKVEELESQLTKGLKNVLQFILGVAARAKTEGITREELIDAYNGTLCGFENPLEHPFLRKEDLTTQIEKTLKLSNERVHITKTTAQVQGNVLHAKGGGGDYDITLSENKCECTCPSYKFSKGRKLCKHIRQLQYDAVLGEIGKSSPEAKAIAMTSFKMTGLKQDPRHMLSTGVDLLKEWEFMTEDQDEKLFITNDGRQALVNYLLEMNHVRLLRDRMRKNRNVRDEEDIIKWVIDDYRTPKQASYDPDEKYETGLDQEIAQGIWQYIKGKSYKEIFGRKRVRSFLDAIETIDQMLNVYLSFCPKNNEELAFLIRTARRRLHYGCPRELLTLQILSNSIEYFKQIQTTIALYGKGIKNAEDIANSTPETIAAILQISNIEAQKVVEKTRNLIDLIRKFPAERSELNRLAAQTGISVEELLDYMLPEEMVKKLVG